MAAAINSGNVFDMWADELTQAGNAIAHAFAMQDKKHCYLYVKSLLSQDLDHESKQNNQIRELIAQWGFCKEIGFVLVARGENRGQHGDEFLEELLEEEGEVVEELLKSSVLDFLNSEYGGSIFVAWLLTKYNNNNLPLLTATVDACDKSKVDDLYDMMKWTKCGQSLVFAPAFATFWLPIYCAVKNGQIM